MKLHKVTIARSPALIGIRACDMRVGQFGTILEGAYKGEVIVKTYDGYTSISKPNHTWSGSLGSTRGPDFRVELANPGDMLSVELGHCDCG